MISSIVWVPAGVADPRPKKYELSSTERELIQMLESQNIDGAVSEEQQQLSLGDKSDRKQQSVKQKQEPNPPSAPSSLPADLRMDEYSDDEDDDDRGGALHGSAVADLVMQKSADGLLDGMLVPEMRTDVDSDDEDDLVDVPDTREYTPIDVEGMQAMALSHVGSNAPVYMGDDNDDDTDNRSDAEDVNISADDALVVIAKTEEDFASLEVHVYEQTTGNLFVHHDIPLPAFPLCLAHGDVSPSGNAGNFCAVGTFSPGIEVWNLDVLNALEPSCILGGEDTSMADELMRYNMMNGPQKGAKHTYASSGNKLRDGSHTDAVMSLSWNTVHRQVIASGSADCTVKLWDVTNASNAGTFSHHSDKVQSVAWHPQEGTLLATGSYDRTVALLDARTAGNTNNSVKKVKIPADCEALAWDSHNPQYLTVASEDGTIQCWDVRKFETSAPAWSFVGNEFGGVDDIAYNPSVPGMLVSCSTDRTVAIYDTQQPQGTAPILCGSKDMKVGKLHTVSFYPSSPWLLACGGSGNELALWDMTREQSVQNRFGSRTAQRQTAKVPDDSSEKAAELEAMMTAASERKTPEDIKNKGPSKKKKKGKKKKKAHKVR